IKEEIKKCDVLCCDCHNALHASETKTNLTKELKLVKKQLQEKNLYTTNRKQHQRLHRKKVTLLARQYVDNFKKRRSCKICKEKNPFCLVFHHRQDEEKIDKIPIIAKKGIKKVKEEIAKCEILCSNCHTKHHFAA
ncbi:hypothetical protein LCGC14_2631690, partial [marine sediment metagenome]